MKYQQYKFKFYLNLRHAVCMNDCFGETHPHTWELTVYIAKVRTGFVRFDEVEREIESYMERFQGVNLNEVDPFDKINPTLENCANYFRERIQEILNESGWILLMMEMSETPSRAYVLSMVDENDIGANQTINTLTDMILNQIQESEV